MWKVYCYDREDVFMKINEVRQIAIKRMLDDALLITGAAVSPPAGNPPDTSDDCDDQQDKKQQDHKYRRREHYREPIGIFEQTAQ